MFASIKSKEPLVINRFFFFGHPLKKKKKSLLILTEALLTAVGFLSFAAP